MDPQPEQPLDDDDNISLEDTLMSLKRNALAVDVHLQESIRKLKQLQKLVAHEMEEPLAEIPLQPKTRLMKWLTDRGLKVESSFNEFFEAFVDEHKKEHRLDLSKRAIRLNTAACVLFGFKDTDSYVSLYVLLEKLPTLYY